MRTCTLLVLGLSVGLGLAEDKPRQLGFGAADLDKVPAGWSVDRTGKGEGSVWKVTADATAPSKSGYVVTQTAVSPKPMFNLCVVEGGAVKDVEATVALKSLDGKIDQGGGILWRYQDANNYYVARVNPLENNFRVYKVVEGARRQLETEEDVPTGEGKWQTIKIRHIGEDIECWLDGKKLFTAKDNQIDRPGRVGLWTKADAKTSFDVLSIHAVKGK